MSNQVVGNIYAQIIDKVIQASQNDFEESGIDQATLAELKEAWQQRLSSYHVAQCPWDPAPVPTPAQNPPTLPSTTTKVEDSPPLPSQPLSNGVRIKTEGGGYEAPQSYSSGMNGYPAAGSTLAAQRAQNLLQQQYGGPGGAALPHGMAQPQPGFALPGQSRQTDIQLPGQPQQRPQQQQFSPQQPSHQQPRAPLSAAQTDGAGDGVLGLDVAISGSSSDRDRIAADGEIKRQIEQMAYRMDNGLMVPLSQVPRLPTRKRKAAAGPSSSDPSQSSLLPTIPQMDGVEDEDDDDEKPIKDEEQDEDAINSDLDDSEDELNPPVDEDEGAAVNEAILCTYDKVQRVKNKWKCTLKDGILSTKGKDYVFHKAQGEFEW